MTYNFSARREEEEENEEEEEEKTDKEFAKWKMPGIRSSIFSFVFLFFAKKESRFKDTVKSDVVSFNSDVCRENHGKLDSNALMFVTYENIGHFS